MEVDELLRELVERTLKGDEDGLAAAAGTASEETLSEVMTLAIRAAGYVVVDSAGKVPTGADLEKASHMAAGSKSGTPVTEEAIRSYLKEVVFGSGTSDFAGQHPLVPLHVLASLLNAFTPPTGKGWNQWLDTIEGGIEAASRVRKEAAPAVVYEYLRK